MIVDERALVAAVRELAAEDPNFSYEPPEGRGGHCKYVHRTNEGHLVGGCIVGRAALRVGVPVESLAALDDLEASPVGEAFSEFSISPQVLKWLGWVQNMQDCGAPWSQAVTYADDEAGDPFA